MGYYNSIFELIDMRSFSNLWYWLVLAVVWSSASHFMIGVPFDLFRRAKYHGGQAEQDMRDLVRIYSNRVNYIMDMSGIPILAVTFFMLTSLFGLGFFYDNEFCQAVFLLVAPLSLLGGLNAFNCHKIKAQGLYDDLPVLFRMLSRYRITVQIIGVLDIAVTSFWGIAINFSQAALAG